VAVPGGAWIWAPEKGPKKGPKRGQNREKPGFWVSRLPRMERGSFLGGFPEKAEKGPEKGPKNGVIWLGR